jgi:hypothetical protein
MKKNASIITLLLIVHFTASAQIQILPDDAPQAGHTYTKKIIHSGYPDLQLSTKGPNVSWDYTTVLSDTTTYNMYSSPTATELIDFPNANLVEFNGVQYEYFQISSTSTYLLGLKDTLSKKLNPPLLYTTFPVTYGNTTTASSSGVIQMPNPGTIALLTTKDADSIRVTLTVEKHDTVDAWGKVSTPLGTFDALRIVSHAKTTTKLEARILPGSLGVLILGGTGWKDVTTYAPAQYTAPTYTRQYNWWAKGVGTEIVQIILNGATGNTVLSMGWYNTSSLSAVNNSLPASLFALSPNPSNGLVNVTMNTPALLGYSITVSDLSGKPCYFGNLTSEMNAINFSFLPDGIYLVKIADKEGNAVVKRMEILK